jgi:hypothetical protein
VAQLCDYVSQVPLLFVNENHSLGEFHADMINDLAQGLYDVCLLLYGRHIDHCTSALDSQLVLSCHGWLPPFNQKQVFRDMN